MVKKVNLLPEKCGYLAKNWFIWFKPACTAQSANPSSKTWFKRPDEQYIHVHYLQLPKMNVIPLAVYGVKWPFSKGHGRR